MLEVGIHDPQLRVPVGEVERVGAQPDHELRALGQHVDAAQQLPPRRLGRLAQGQRAGGAGLGDEGAGGGGDRRVVGPEIPCQHGEERLAPGRVQAAIERHQLARQGDAGCFPPFRQQRAAEAARIPGQGPAPAEGEKLEAAIGDRVDEVGDLHQTPVPLPPDPVRLERFAPAGQSRPTHAGVPIEEGGAGGAALVADRNGVSCAG
jgi:hypothetical protein